MDKRKKEDISLVLVSTGSNSINELKTIEHCQNIFPCEQAIYFTFDKSIKSDKVTIVSNVYGLDKYCGPDFFILSQLPNYIRTPYYLIVSINGFILNPDKWDDEFKKYHYLAGAWELHPYDYHPSFQPVAEHNRIGCGGFSLRSRLLGMTVAGIFNEMSKQSSFSPFENWSPEDKYICHKLKPLLESKGFKFGNLDTATRFCARNKLIQNEFGFYGSATMTMNNLKYIA